MEVDMGSYLGADAVPPPPSIPSEILVCQAGACRKAGSEAVLVEIEELAKGLGCVVEPSGCVGACNQAPNAIVVKGRRESVATRLDTVEKSAAVVQKATGKMPSLEDPALVERLSDARQMRVRMNAREVGKWNIALSGIAQQLTRKSGNERLQLQFEYSQLLTSAGLWEDADCMMAQAQAHCPWNLALLMERAKLFGKLGRFEELEALTERVKSMPLETCEEIEVTSLLARCKNDPSSKLEQRPVENYSAWNLESVTEVSKHSAIYRFSSKDRTRGTPNIRGRGRVVWPKTWHTTLLAPIGDNKEGPLSWIERDYTPISSAKDWEKGQVDILIKVYNTGLATSWLRKQPLGCRVLLSKPAKTLSVPSLVDDITQATLTTPASVLLVLAGSGIVVAPQVLHHSDLATCFGPRLALTQPVHLVYSCRGDDVCMHAELAAWCGAGRLKSCTVVLTEPQAGAQAPFPEGPDADLGGLASLPNVQVVRSRLSGELLQSSVSAAPGPCRIVVSGPATFNSAVKEMLSQSGVPSGHVTILSAG